MQALRDLWAGEAVEGAVLPVRPLQEPLELWMGGRTEASLRRVGRLGDGWLSGALGRAEAAAARAVIDEAAADHGRAISPEHFGTNISYARRPLPDEVRAAMVARAKGADVRPGTGRAGRAAGLRGRLG